MDRRTFLKSTAAGGAIVSLGVGAPGCGNDVAPAPLADVAESTTPMATAWIDRSTGVIQLTVADPKTMAPVYPDLAPIGGAITLRLPASYVNNQSLPYAVPPDGTILVVHYGPPNNDKVPEFQALQSSCPHAACPLGYNGTDQKVECPCHGSRFFPVALLAETPIVCGGDIAHGPARGPLLSWATTFDAATQLLSIDLATQLACNPPLPPIVGGTLTLRFTDFPQLMMPGGSVVGPVPGRSSPLLIVRVDSATAAALDARCTHLGCTVNYNSKNADVECPCHGSVFGLDGKVLAPPAPSPLPTFGATVMADSIVVTGL